MYQVDAFTNNVFGGNPAAVIPLDEWLPDELLQNIAEENNLSETAYFVKNEDHYHLRWFTPTMEIELCGHATLASAFVLFEILGFKDDTIRFESMNGTLYVTREGDLLSMDFPVTHMQLRPSHDVLVEALGPMPTSIFESETKLMAVYEEAEIIYNMQPDFAKLKLAGKNTIITSRGEDCDFISRFFAPVSGIDEDPVTGSAHTALTPYWAKVLGKNILTAKQVSKRGGDLQCELAGNRVLIMGEARLYLSGRIEI